MNHHVRFERSVHGQLYRAICSCGWVNFDHDLTKLQVKASTHDMEWEPVEPAGVLEPERV